MNFYLSEVPFSRFDSYMALAELPDWWQGHKIEHGIYLKNVSGSTQNPIVAKFIFFWRRAFRRLRRRFAVSRFGRFQM